MDERLAEPLPVPVLTVGADGGVGEKLNQSLQGAATTMTGTVLAGCGHYLPGECPAQFDDAIERFWRAGPAMTR